MDLFDKNCKCSGEEEKSCPVNDAKTVCDKLGIKHYVADFKQEFKEKVISDFISEYKKARTPNPCVQCNKYLKFGAMYEKAKELGCEYISTGHYARTEYSEEYKQYVIIRATSEKKDQSYVLYNIPKEIVSKVLFPLGTFESKDEIRKIVHEKGLEIAQKPDSQEICFIPDNDYVKYILDNGVGEDALNTPFTKPGNIITLDGKVLGKHKGLIHYTIGQRKGLGISYSTPLYVLNLNRERNEVLVRR